MYPVAERLGALADTVQAAYQQFGEKDYLREPLKASFILTLTVVLLLSLLAAWYGAIFTAQRLVQPIQDLVQGTRAVAQGDLDTRLPLTSHDEMGFLVHSFNDMTKRLRARPRGPAPRAAGGGDRARQPRGHPRAPVDRRDLARARPARAHGEPRGGHDPRRGHRVARRRAVRRSSARADEPRCGSSPRPAAARFAAGDVEWREQFTLPGRRGPPHPDVRLHAAAGRRRRRRAATCSCSTTSPCMLQAQREAAWGEVARRLAHEIKNPLTPIRLSAERMRHKLLPAHDRPKDAQMLERATETIVQQVEAMKEMVNAFSEYARAPRLEMATVDLNKLVTEVTDLYRAQGAIRGVRLDGRPRPDARHAWWPTRAACDSCCNNLLTNAVEALEGAGRWRDRGGDAARRDAAAPRSPRSRSRTTGPGSSAS